MRSESSEGIFTIFLEGDIDAQNAAAVQQEMEEILKSKGEGALVLDARDLKYISSAGLRMLLGVQQKLGNKKLVIRNVSKAVYDIFEMTKFTMLMQVERALREIDVIGATVVGKGRSSTVYRIGDETIVKLYAAGVPLEKIRQEMDLAKKAFVAGVPTAISYDMVTSKTMRKMPNCGMIFCPLPRRPSARQLAGELVTMLRSRLTILIMKNLPMLSTMCSGWCPSLPRQLPCASLSGRRPIWRKPRANSAGCTVFRF